ncbi:LysR family transcriptional regulator [Streptomyces sp. NPDC001523]|uniref:helix-turn-helix domain-containing protein n=1 Tax=Streptomyces sp. NPDC001523 TaxID=3154383 RepID=UPI00332A2C25
MTPTPAQLRHLVAVADCRSVTGAAASVFVARSALSRAVQAMEWRPPSPGGAPGWTSGSARLPAPGPGAVPGSRRATRGAAVPGHRPTDRGGGRVRLPRRPPRARPEVDERLAWVTGVTDGRGSLVRYRDVVPKFSAAAPRFARSPRHCCVRWVSPTPDDP